MAQQRAALAQQTAEGEDDEEDEKLVVRHGLLSTRRVKVDEKILSVVFQPADETCIVLCGNSVGCYNRGVCTRLVTEVKGCRKLLYLHFHNIFVGVGDSSLKVQHM